MAYNPLNPNGQATMANSQPVVLSSNQTPVSVAGTVGASIIGTAPVTMAGAWTTSVVGSVTALQGTNPWIITGSVQASITPEANQSVSGTVGASIIGLTPVAVTNIPSVSGTVNVGNIVPVTLSGNPSISGTVIVTQGTTPWTISSIYGNISGSVVGFQGGAWSASISGSYPTNNAFSIPQPGLLQIGVRNDTVSSFVGTDKNFTPMGFDSAGRSVIKPFAPDEARIFGHTSMAGVVSVLGIAAAGAGLRNYITDVTVMNTGSVATLITFTDTDASVLGRTIAPAGGGSNITGLNTPMRTSPNQVFNVVSSIASSNVYVTIYGYKAP